YYSTNIGNAVTIGPYGSLGAIFGTLPGTDVPLRRHLLLDGGALVQVRYRVADVDSDTLSGVFGQMYLGYRRANYFRGQVPGSKYDKDVDRLVADLRLSFQEISSKTVRPMVYATFDKSFSGSLHRDRVGVLLEIDLKTLFKGPTAEASAKVKALKGDGSETS